MLGVQHDSRKASAPVFGFGSSDRNALAKVYISAEHNRADFGKLGPGAVYGVKAVRRARFEQERHPPRFPSAPRRGFLKPSAARASATRGSRAPAPTPRDLHRQVRGLEQDHRGGVWFRHEHEDHAAKVFLSAEQAKVFFGLESPGPAAYKVLSGVGARDEQQEPHRAGVFDPEGAELKYDYVERAKRLPGAGLYDRPGAVGPQVEATKATRPTVGFGTSTRDHAAKVFLGNEQAKVFYGMESPGPAALGPGAFGGTGGWWTARSRQRRNSHSARARGGATARTRTRDRARTTDQSAAARRKRPTSADEREGGWALDDFVI